MPKTLPSPPPAPAAARNEYTVDDLARVADTTVRNVRAHQDRGLLAPPEKRGRVGVYDDTHVSRLRLINHLLTRGYTLANIQGPDHDSRRRPRPALDSRPRNRNR